jgi:hypothetical protein
MLGLMIAAPIFAAASTITRSAWVGIGLPASGRRCLLDSRWLLNAAGVPLVCRRWRNVARRTLAAPAPERFRPPR